ncbi:MAG: ABC transporter ATP-binding protein [Pseudomonadota bacterium]
MTPPLVDVNQVGIRFGSFDAVSDVSLSVADGEIVTLVGPSGCGKSSVLRTVAGLETAAKGRVSLRGAAALSFVFQDAALLPWLTVEKNVALPLRLSGADGGSRVEEALERVGLADRPQAFPSQLSGGMRMRVSIARALVSQPDVMLMDEPFAALDELRRFDLAKLVRDIAKTRGLAVLFVTHSVFEACFISDRVLVMTPRPGRIATDITVDGDGQRSADFRESDAFAKASAEVSTALRAASFEVAS